MNEPEGLKALAEAIMCVAVAIIFLGGSVIAVAVAVVYQGRFHG